MIRVWCRWNVPTPALDKQDEEVSFVTMMHLLISLKIFFRDQRNGLDQEAGNWLR
jgi:hypothetical protein